MNAGPNTALVVIDAQRAFVDPEGSVARTFGIDDVQPGVAALGRLCRFIAGHRSIGPTIFVRSEYRPGQFTSGDLNHGMAHVCVPGRNIDCEWASGVDALTARRRSHEAPRRRRGVGCVSRRDRAGDRERYQSDCGGWVSIHDVRRRIGGLDVGDGSGTWRWRDRRRSVHREPRQ